MIKRNLSLLCILLLLTGCATTHPVVVGCHPKLPPEPHYPASDLKSGDKDATVAKAYVASLGLAIDDDRMARNAVKRCE